MKKFFAKLHLWLAVPFGIVIAVLCLTGAILVFESEIKEWTSPSLYKASYGCGDALPFGELVARVEGQLPDSVHISSIQIPSSPKKNYRLGMEGQRRTSVLVDPYTGEVKGVVRPYAKGEFFTFVRRLHRWFLLQVQGPGISWGKLITGTATLVFVFILVSGIVIWMPKTMKGLKKRLTVKRGAGKFRFWYDFHLSFGKMASLVLLVMALTGLTWSFDWYRSGFYKVFGVELPSQGGATHGVEQSGGNNPGEESQQRGKNSQTAEEPTERDSARTGSHGEETGAEMGGRPEREHGNSHTPVRAESDEGSGPRGGRPDGDQGGERGSRGRGQTAPKDFTLWEKAVAEVIARNPRYRTVTVQQGSVSVANNRYGNTRASDSYLFDGMTGEITSINYYRDQPRSAKIRGWIYAVHVGSWGGIYTKIIYFIVCLVGFALPVTGYYIWIRKRWKKWRRTRSTASV